MKLKDDIEKTEPVPSSLANKLSQLCAIYDSLSLKSHQNLMNSDFSCISVKSSTITHQSEHFDLLYSNMPVNSS